MNANAAGAALVVAGTERARVDRFLAAEGNWGTRSQVQRLIAAGRVWVNDKPAKPGTLVRPGDVVRVVSSGAQPQRAKVEPAEIHLQVLYEDDDVMVIDKPPGLVVHPAPGHWQGTLVSGLLHRWQGSCPGLDPLRPGIVHRLDRDTSGVLVIGKTPAAVASLGAQFRTRAVRKEYVAIVWGCPQPRRGVIEQPVGRHPKQRQRMAVRAGGRRAVTRYEVLEVFRRCALLRLVPETGRTHQIRVHLAAIGHPVVGDTVYGRHRTSRDPVLQAVPRQALHAAVLYFKHPRTGVEVKFRAPRPADFRALLGQLRAAAAAAAARDTAAGRA